MDSRTERKVANLLTEMHLAFPGRVRIRRSFNGGEKYCAVTENSTTQAFDCPEQKGKVDSCGSCMACVTSTKNVRFETHSYPLKAGHNALVMKTTQYQKGIKDVNSNSRILKPGNDNNKLGGKVTKGLWKGAKLLSVTGIERFHCPHTCPHREDCYGNSMQFAHRFQLDNPIVQKKLYNECMSLPVRKGGYVIRLHVLGDFCSPEYVMLWWKILNDRKDIAIFGFTAHDIDTNERLW